MATGSTATWEKLGLVPPLIEAVKALKWSEPSGIQAAALPHALAGKDVIGLAETGSGKTGAFALPILQALLEVQARMFAVVLAPTRELAVQIADQFKALGAGINLKTAVIVGGVDQMEQALALARKPHVIVATPGRLVDHLENTTGFSLRSVQYVVMDEADRMLSMDFGEAIDKILASVPRAGRRTFLFSATMTSKVKKLQRASLNDPVKVEVSSSKYATVATLKQEYLLLPAKYKDCYATFLLNEFTGVSTVVFVSTCATAARLRLMLDNLGFKVAALHGQMSQSKRLGALSKFKAGDANILLATDVASRGLDIPHVDLVINYDVPLNGKDYVHRVGRTARAGRSGRALTMVTQYDIEAYKRVEELIGMKMTGYDVEESTVLLLLERVTEAARLAAIALRESAAKAGKKRRGRGGADLADLDDAEAAAAIIEESSAKRAAARKASKHGKKAARSR